jgi:hypothetical protein
MRCVACHDKRSASTSEGLPAASTENVLVAVIEDEVVGYARVERQVGGESAIKYPRARLYVHELGVSLRAPPGSGHGTHRP